MTTSTDILRLRGTQQQMGHQHGSLVRQLGGWEDVVAYYPSMPKGMLFPTASLGPVERVARGAMTPLLGLALRRLYSARPAEYRERTEAFGEALGVDQSRAPDLGVMDVAQNFIGTLTRLGLVPFAQRAASALPPMCSSLAVWGRASEDGRVLHGRNFDFPGQGIWERRPAVVFCTPDTGVKYGFVTTRGADTPGVTSFNEAGITLAAHTRFHRDVRFDGRSVIDLGHDLIRRAESLDDAIRIARELPSASSWGFLVSSARERDAVLLEFTGSRVEVTRAGRGEDFLGHTNRYRHPALQVDEVTPAAAWIAHSDGRYASLMAGIARHAAEGLGVDELCALFGSHIDGWTGAEEVGGGVLAQPDTVQSVVVDPEHRALHIGVGDTPVSRTAWTKLDWSWDGPSLDEVPAPAASGFDSRFIDGPAAEAWKLWAEACRLEYTGVNLDRIERNLERATELDPSEGWYRMIAGTLALRRGDFDAGLTHLQAGIGTERSEFRRGQLLLWASRAAQVTGRPDDAQAHRQQLLGLAHPLLASHRQAALRESSVPMAARKMVGVPINITLGDAG